LFNEEFHDFHTSPLFISDEVTGNEMGGAYDTLGVEAFSVKVSGTA